MHALTLASLSFLLLGEPVAAENPAVVARQILDESQPADKRQQLAARQAGRAGAVVAALAADLPDNQPAEEYRRIPWIWRVAITAGKANDAQPVRELLEVSLPRKGERLRDWQAVVIGGGIINGISQTNVWPKPRIEELIGNDEALAVRWRQALAAAAIVRASSVPVASAEGKVVPSTSRSGNTFTSNISRRVSGTNFE